MLRRIGDEKKISEDKRHEFNILGEGVLLKVHNNHETGLHKVFVHTPKNILRALVIPFEFIFHFIHAFYEPKAFTLDKLHEMKVNLIHAEAGTVGTPNHNRNRDLSKAAGIAYGSHLNWERRKSGLI